MLKPRRKRGKQTSSHLNQTRMVQTSLECQKGETGIAVRQRSLQLVTKLRQLWARSVSYRRQPEPGKGLRVRNVTKRNAPMVDARLLSMLDTKGVPLHKISVGVLRLGGHKSRRLTACGIRNIGQLSNCSESDLLIVPRFGSFTVRQVKAKLNSYLTAILNESVPYEKRPLNNPRHRLDSDPC